PPASHPSGEILFNGKNLLAATESEMRKIRGDGISIIFQEPMTSLNPLHTIEKQVGEVLKVHRGMSSSAARTRVLELLAKVGIRDPEKRLDSYPHQLSGGQRQRVMIAMSLANDPDLLIADEPTTALDVTTQAQILALLEDLQRDMGMAVLIITHDLGIVEKISDELYVMKDGRIVEHGPGPQPVESPRETHTRDVLSAEPPKTPAREFGRAEPVLKAEHVRVWFPIRKGVLKRTVGHIKAADDISFEVRAGETVGIVGESGSGKTTLALGVLRLEQSRGRIEFEGRDIQGLHGEALKPVRRQMQVVFQDPYGSLSPRLSIHRIVEEGLVAHGIGDEAEREARVIAALEEVGLDPASRFRYPHEFSGGQRQRVAIARAMIMQP